MKFETVSKKGKCNATAEGELTIYCARDLKEKIQKCINESKSISLDLSKVEEIDTSCFQLLMQAKQACEKADKRFNLSATSPAVRDVMSLYGLESFFGEQHSSDNR